MTDPKSIRVDEQGRLLDKSGLPIGNTVPIRLKQSDRMLISELSNKISVVETRSGIRIKSRNHVGVIPFSECNLMIMPKINVENIIPMMIYSGQFGQMPRIRSIGFKKDEGMNSMVIRVFLDMVGELLNNEVARSYVYRVENLSSPRGRLQARSQMLNTARGKTQFVCKHDKFEYNVPENRLILYCLQKCRFFNISTELKSRSIRLSNILMEYGVNTITQMPHDYLARISYNGINRYYRIIHDLCMLILENIGIKNFYINANRQMLPFLVDMSRVFEKFVEKLLYNHFKNKQEYKIKPQNQIKSWILNSRHIPIRPDILVCRKNNIIYIIDAKYKIAKEGLPEADAYQLAFYGYRLDKKLIHAILPKPSNEGVADYIMEPYEHGIHIKVCFLDVDKILSKINNGDDISCDLDRILEPTIRDAVIPVDISGAKTAVSCSF